LCACQDIKLFSSINIFKGVFMTQTTQGTGAGSVYDIFPRIINGKVTVQNIVGDILENSTEQITISTADGTENIKDAKNIYLTGGDGFLTTAEDDNDGGSIYITGGKGNGDGEGGNVEIRGGDIGDVVDANAGTIIIKGGDAGTAENSDAGDVNIYGGSASTGIGDSDGGSILLQAGNAGDDGQAGNVTIQAGNSGNGDNSTGNLPEAGDIRIYAGDSTATTNVDGGDINIEAGDGTVNGRGGDLTLITGNSVGTDRAGDINITCGTNSGAGRDGHIYLNSMPRIPVYANATARDAAAGTATNGMICYNTATSNIEVYVGGAWKSVDVSAIV
jgi:hypothetical protein